ncbi:MAG: 50S ribosomal protein L6 [Spirochaetia bacterium]|jgi:large subunit ribosomal protein L6|nr:50S ribosomal protein L6 [Spirochaetia bacterium]
MSRIGKMPVAIPAGVKVAVADGLVTVEGPKGKLSQTYRPEVTIEAKDKEVLVTFDGESKVANSYQGLYRQLIHNMVIGVSEGFSKTLLINGVGYRAEVKGKVLTLNLGYSTVIEFIIPQGITMECENPGKIKVSGIDKQLVGQTAAEIRSLRSPEPYKGKGIKYEDEVIRRKVGKSGK